MSEPILHADQICQVAIVVRDIEKTSKAVAALLGVEPAPWRITDTADKSQINYRGSTTSARAKLAFFNLGPLQLELIEPVGAPSTWQEHLDQHGPGLHHIAFKVKGMTQTLAALDGQKIPTIQRGEFTGGRYAYVDGVPEIGAVLELLEIDGK